MAGLQVPDVPVIEFDFLAAPQRERDVHDAGWYWGYREGLAAGRRQRDAERDADDEARWASMAAAVRALGGPLAMPYSRLCELRNEPERAERARDHEHRLGLIQ